ncbi:proteophosphoglycan 5 [Ceratobasidium sp. AG-Ba]|nr:proteophosphoglycan 5 [Ceratobasidium sp. AG-Ba]
MRIPTATHRSRSVSSQDTISALLPSMDRTPRLRPSTMHRSRTLSSVGSLSAATPSVIPSMVGKTSVESPLSSTVSSASFTTMPTIIAPPAAPPTPSPLESPSLTSISSLSTSIPITPSASLYPNGSIRLLWTIESDRTYDSADLQPSPFFIPVDLPEEPEYEPSYSGLEGTMSEISAASPGYDAISHHISMPSVASMDSRLIDCSSPKMSRGSDRRPSLTPWRIEGSLMSDSTITLPPLPPSPERTASLHTTHASSISLTTPGGNRPSIEPLETIYSVGELGEGGIPPSHIISHDVNQLLQYLHDVGTVRDGKTRDMTDHLRRMEEELFDLSVFLRQRRPTPPIQPKYVPHLVKVPAPAPAPTPVVVPFLVLVPAAAPEPAPTFKEYVPGSDATTDISLTVREEEAMPIARPVMPRLTLDVSSLDLSESIESMSEHSLTAPSVTLSEESSVSRSMLSSSVVTQSPSLTISDISGDLLRALSVSICEQRYSPISLDIPISPSLSSAATPELSPPSSQSSSSAELPGLTPSPSIQPEVLPDITIKTSSPALTTSPPIPAATERSKTPLPEHVPAKRVRSLSPPPIRRPSPVASKPDYFISSPLSQDTFRDLPCTYSTSPSMSVISIWSQETAKPDSKGSMGIEELRSLLKDLKQQDVVAGCQDDHTALLEELRNRPPPTIVYQAPEVSELSKHRVALTKIEHILDDLVDRFNVVRDSISSSSILTRSSTLTASSETVSSSTVSQRSSSRILDDERSLHCRWDEMTKWPRSLLSQALMAASLLPGSQKVKLKYLLRQQPPHCHLFQCCALALDVVALVALAQL